MVSVDRTQGYEPNMKWLLSKYPFNAEQTVNILGEFGPLVAMFVVNAMSGIIAGVAPRSGNTRSMVKIPAVTKRATTDTPTMTKLFNR